jgi:hypothetical protein
MILILDRRKQPLELQVDLWAEMLWHHGSRRMMSRRSEVRKGRLGGARTDSVKREWSPNKGTRLGGRDFLSN